MNIFQQTVRLQHCEDAAELGVTAVCLASVAAWLWSDMTDIWWFPEMRVSPNHPF